VVVSFQCVAPGIDETPHAGESAASLVARLSLAKARAVASQHRDAWVIGSDQAAVLLDPLQQESILGKPGTRSRCMEQLAACSGKTVNYLTGVALVRGAEVFEFVDATRVTFRTLDAPTIARYVDRESTLDCAGGLKSASIDTDDPSALIGLPLIRLCEALRRVGFDVP
jgi:septum formation protein